MEKIKMALYPIVFVLITSFISSIAVIANEDNIKYKNDDDSFHNIKISLLSITGASFFLLVCCILYMMICNDNTDNNEDNVHICEIIKKIIVDCYCKEHKDDYEKQLSERQSICKASNDNNDSKIIFVFKFFLLIITSLLYLIYYLTLYPILNIIKVIVRDPIYLFTFTLTGLLFLSFYRKTPNEPFMFENFLENIFLYVNRNNNSILVYFLFIIVVIVVLVLLYVTPLTAYFLNSVKNDDITFEKLLDVSINELNNFENIYKSYYNTDPKDNFNIFKLFCCLNLNKSQVEKNKYNNENLINNVIDNDSNDENSRKFFKYVKKTLYNDPYEYDFKNHVIFKDKFLDLISNIDHNIVVNDTEIIKIVPNYVVIDKYFTNTSSNSYNAENKKKITTDNKDKKGLHITEPKLGLRGVFNVFLICLFYLIILTCYFISYIGLNTFLILISITIFSFPFALIVKIFTTIFSNTNNMDEDNPIKKYINLINNGFNFFNTSKIKYFLFVSFIIILGINSWVFFGKISNYYANETLSYLGGTTATILAVLLLLLSNTGGSNNKKDETP